MSDPQVTVRITNVVDSDLGVILAYFVDGLIARTVGFAPDGHEQ